MGQEEDALPKRIGEYEVKGLLGAGGFGKVYQAVNRLAGWEAAVKVFAPRGGNERLAASSGESRDGALRALRERFIEEASILKDLESVAAVVDVSHVGELESGEPYYVMRYMAESLADRIGRDVFDEKAQAALPEGERPRALDHAEGARILGQVLEGLSAAHGKGLVHRDVKPSNVLLDGDGKACVSDFGIAKLPDSKLTEAGMGFGTRDYMAPEQRQGARHVDARADVYSFGRLAYRVLTGRLPDGHYVEPMDLALRMGRSLNGLIKSCLAEERGDRPGTAGEVLERWQAALAEEAPLAEEAGRARVAPVEGTEANLGESPAPSGQKPLRDAIEKALLARGDVEHARVKLKVLARIAGVDEAGLDLLIEDMRAGHQASIGALLALREAVDMALGESGGELPDEMVDVLRQGARARGLEERLGDIVAWRREEYKREASTEDDPAGRGGRPAHGGREANVSAKSGGEGVKRAPRIAPGKVVLRPGDRFQDGADCPEMVVVPAGSFWMGSPPEEPERYRHEGPVHQVRVARPFAMSVYAVTFAEWDACVSDGGCGGYSPADEGWGRGRRPVINVSWKDTKAYVEWLWEKTGKRYRLPSESEWEYAARAGTETKYSWGDEIGVGRACCRGCGGEWDGRGKTAPVGSFEANAFRLHDMHGNVREWVEDRYHDRYKGAPSDGNAWVSGGRNLLPSRGDAATLQALRRGPDRVLRGGSWSSEPSYLRAAHRFGSTPGNRDTIFGFRVARTLAS